MAARTWLDAWSERQQAAHELADRPTICVVIDETRDGADIHTLALGSTAADAEAAALAILGDILDHHADDDGKPDLCAECQARIDRVKAAFAALLDGREAPVPLREEGARLQ